MATGSPPGCENTSVCWFTQPWARLNQVASPLTRFSSAMYMLSGPSKPAGSTLS